MKNLFKFTAAALALVAFASCSENDDLLSSKNAVQTKDFTSVLEFEVEEPDGLVSTRAARDANGAGFVYQQDDQLRVYDPDLGLWDLYTFDTKFGREGDTKLEKAPTYALFPAEDIRKAYFNGTAHVAEMIIGEEVESTATPGTYYSVIEYSKTAGSETTVGDKVLYQCDIPMWGSVEKVDDSTVKTTGKGLQPLSGVLMLTLGNTLGNASWLKLSSATGYLAGTFYANLDDAEPAFYVNSENEYKDLKRELYIDLRNVPSDNAVLYIPILPGIKDLKIARASEKADDPTNIAPANWTTISDESGYTFKRNGWHKVGYTYTLAAQTPWEISGVLSQLNDQTEDMTLDLTKILQLAVKCDPDEDGTADVDDETIYVPNMAASTVTIDIKNDVNTTIAGLPAGYTAQAAASTDLNIVDLDATDPFTGTLVIKASKLKNTVDFNINLPQAKVVLLGDFTDTNVSSFNNIVASELQFGDGTTATKIDVTAGGTDLGLVSTSIDILKGATITGDIDAATSAVSVFAPITIKGKVVGDIDTKGDVSVELATVDEAITGTLTFYRGGTTCTLKQGFIGTITNDFSGLGEANNHEVTVKLDDANGVTAIKDVNVDDTDWADSKITLTESTLSTAAKGIDNATLSTTYINATNTVYTAAQLERLHTTGTAKSIVMGNDVNMANAAWTAPFGNGEADDFSIESNVAKTTRTIKNLSYNGYKASVKGIGFVGNAKKLTVTDIKFDNVSFTKAYLINDDDNTKSFEVKFVGGICGIATGAVAITRSTVNLANNFGYSGYSVESHKTVPSTIPVDASTMGIGGLVGKAEAGITLTKAAVSGALIQGYTSLGGFFGLVVPSTNDITFDKDCSSNITAFKSNYSNPAATDIEMNFYRAAAGIGYLAFPTTAVAQTITIGSNTANKPTATAVAITVPAGKDGRNYVALGSGAGQTLWSYAKGQEWIGFSGAEDAPGLTNTANTIKIGNVNYSVPQVAAGATSFTALIAPVKPLYIWTQKNQ